MAIPFTEYIDITNHVPVDVFGRRDWSVLVFSNKPLKEEVAGDIKTKYAESAIAVSKNDISNYFDDENYENFLTACFSYNGGTTHVTKVNVALIGASESAKDAYDRVTKVFANFGAFHFYDTAANTLTDVAKANSDNEYGWVMVVGTSKTSQDADANAIGTSILTHLTHAPECALAWYASVNYDSAGSSGTIDYKQFPDAKATIYTQEDKGDADDLKVNYIGKVQNYGNGLEFYQTGVNMDGTDLGVVRDMCWLNGLIISAYFNLQTSVQKVPANATGAAMVRNIVVDAATRGINAGAILIDKPLDATQISDIESYTGDQSAADSVSTTGYYVDAKIVKGNKGRYYCQYTLVYAKGDHIAKVSGMHILI